MDFVALFFSIFIAIGSGLMVILLLVKDEYPQLLKLTVQDTVASQLVEASFLTGVIPTSSKGKSMVMNVQKIIFSHPIGENNSGDGTAIEVGTSSQSAREGPAGNGVIAYSERHLYSASGGMAFLEQVQTFDDGLGRGILIATDKIYLRAQGISQTVTAGHYKATIVYNYVEVPLEEYLGIISQANQAN